MKKKLKIFHGPINIGGMAGVLSEYQRNQGYISDFIVFDDNKYIPNSDYNFNLSSKSHFKRKFIRLYSLVRSLLKYDIFHFYFGHSFFNNNRDLPLLKIFKKKIIMTYCGSEIRLVEIEKKRNSYWELLKIGLDDPMYDSAKRKMMRYHNKYIDKFIAPKGLYDSAVQEIDKEKIVRDLWIHHLIIHKDEVRINIPSNDIPVILHAPSEKSIKGTEYVRESIDKLKKINLRFDYIELHGEPHQKINEIMQSADIIIDQLLLGSFGTFAMEGMYNSKVVCGYIMDELREKYFPDLPIVNCTIDNLHEKLEWLIENKEERMKIGLQGKKFVDKYCDYEKTNKAIIEIYEKLLLEI